MATYSSFNELKDKQLKLGDTVQFTIKNENLVYTVYSSFLADLAHNSNTIIFEKLNISDKNKYASFIYDYTVVNGKGSASWPAFRENDYKAATKLVCNLFKKCEDVGKDPLYKEGDVVVIKDAYDLGCNESDYPCGFMDTMIKKYGGVKVTIDKVLPLEPFFKHGEFYLEDYKYIIKEDEHHYSWTAGMFKDKVEDLKSSKFTFTKKDIPENCPYHPYVIDQALVEYSKGVESAISNLKEGFYHCISHAVGSWFTWKKTSQGFNYWNYLSDHPRFIPENYIPTYFIEEMPADIDGLVEYCKKDISDTVTYCSSKISHTSLEIPCNYEEVTLSIKKKKVHF